MYRPLNIQGITPTNHPPNHPPFSPALSKSLSPNTEDLITPVIVSNPNFLPPPPLLARYSPHLPSPRLPPRPDLGSRLPQPSGRWDNITSTPSYQRSDQEFWHSRQFPIPVRSTINSTLSVFGFTPDSDNSSEAFEKENPLDIEETDQELEMPDS